jgi:hypothetical protein
MLTSSSTTPCLAKWCCAPTSRGKGPFKDDNPQASSEERYKALANVGEHQLVALVSPDGIRWRLLQKEPVLAYLPGNPMMDPPNLAFWDENQQQYVAYLRNWLNYRIRGFRRSTSKDFRHWTTPVEIDLSGSEISTCIPT